MPAIRYMKTPCDMESAWDGPAMEAELPNDAGEATFRKFYAWMDSAKDPDTKAAYKFGHHMVDAKGNVGAANYKACSAGIAVLNGGRGGTKIPEADRKAVYNHLAAHIREGGKEPPALNSLGSDEQVETSRKEESMQKHRTDVHIEFNSFVDEGEGLLVFPNKQVVTDNTEQRNGTRYDIGSMDLSEYKGQLTAGHTDMLQSVIGKVKGVAKVGTQVVIDAVQFAVKENPLGRLAYDLFKGGFITDFSIESYGAPPDDEGVYFDARLIGLSAVVVGNNRNATLNRIVTNSIEQSRQEGLDVTDVEKHFLAKTSVKQTPDVEKIENDSNLNDEPSNTPDEPKVTPPAEPEEPEVPEPVINNSNKREEDMKFVTIKNSREFAVKVAYKNAAGEDTETEVAPNEGVDVSEDQQEKVEQQLKDAKDPNAAKTDRDALLADVKNMFAEVVKPLQEKVEAIEQNAFDKGAKEPEFKKDEQSNGEQRNKTEESRLKAMGWQDRTTEQIELARQMLVSHDMEASQKLRKINEFNLGQLKKDGKVSNALTISDFGNFVTSPELLTEIEGCRNDYTGLVAATDWKETMATRFAWLKRSGDVNMQSVEFCDDGADGNLKPVSEYTATPETSDLEELAAVTPVCNALTRFLAADILGDVAQGYRTDYDRKRAQLVIARLEQAVESNGNSVVYDVNPAVDSLTNWIEVWSQIATCTPNGTFVFNASTLGEVLKRAITAGSNGPLSTLFLQGQNGMQMIFGRPYIVVPDDLMPSLNSAGTVTIAVDGANVTVNHGVFYAKLENFTGRTSGGLQYDLSTDASYEQGGATKSAFQRNEVVLRGSFFRGGAIKDDAQVAGLLSPGVS